MRQTHLSRLLKYDVHFWRFSADMDFNCTKVTLAGEQLSRFEARGTPAGKATAAFQLLAEEGFNLGKDKNLNKILADAVKKLLEENNTAFIDVTSEKQLDFCGLIPDNAIHYADRITCIEYTWRKDDFLTGSNRATAAQYILRKLQSYARQLGWTDA